MMAGVNDRRTVLALSMALGAALLAIAFLLGRESAGTPGSDPAAANVVAPPVVEPEREAAAEEESAKRWPKWADLTDWDDSEDRATGSTEAPIEKRIERPHEDSFALTSAGSQQQSPTDPKAPKASSNAPTDRGGAAVANYFQQVDFIHSEEGSGDPQAFALSLINPGLRGSTSGFDQLIKDTKRMEQEMRQVTPPPSCQSYHEASLEALVESGQMLETIKRAVTQKDMAQLSAITHQAQGLRSKAEAIEKMRERLLAASASY